LRLTHSFIALQCDGTPSREEMHNSYQSWAKLILHQVVLPLPLQTQTSAQLAFEDGGIPICLPDGDGVSRSRLHAYCYIHAYAQYLAEKALLLPPHG
jgi:hypothetical protein